MKFSKKQKRRLLLIVISAALLISAHIIRNVFSIEGAAAVLLFMPSYLTVGADVIISAVKGIGRGQIFDEVFLMSAATVGAFFIGEYTEACAVMLFFKIGELFELTASQSARNSIAALAKNCPDSTRIMRGGEWTTVGVDEVVKGDKIRVLPGERVPVDVVIDKGSAYFDTSSMTGESVPVYGGEGDAVMSGFICSDSAVECTALETYENSASARVMELMESASLRKSKSENFISRFSLFYTPAVVFLAIALAVIPPLLSLGGFPEYIKRALTFLVVSCPCALVISVPLTYFAAVGRAAKNGIIFKSNLALERLTKVKECAFDKTGTVTSGEFSVYEIRTLGCDERTVLSVAASLERHSNHPIARSVVKKADELGIDCADANGVTEERGKGMIGTVNGKMACAMRADALSELSLEYPFGEKRASEVCVVYDGALIGVIYLADTVKDGAAKEIEKLSSLGVRCHLLTGDSENAAKSAAESVGIKNVRAKLLPEDKVNIVDELSKKGETLFVGDGMNDAPVMAMASVSMAMGMIGSDAAIEAADAVIVDDNISKIAFSLRLARASDRIVKQNVIFALSVKFAVLLLGALGSVGLWWAVFADVGVSVIAVLNSMRMLSFK